jgi:hypothetical protein
MRHILREEQIEQGEEKDCEIFHYMIKFKNFFDKLLLSLQVL